MELIYKEEAYAIVGACFEVYNVQGYGFLEPVYQECLHIELGLRSIPAAPKPELILSYKGHTLLKRYEADYVCYGKIIVELKSVSTLLNEHRAQVHNYLKATGFRLALLVNFGNEAKLEYERIVR